MWWNKQKEKAAPEVKEEPEVKPELVAKSVIMELTLVNNRTDKEYVIKSVNDFGLKWEYLGKPNSNFCVINQRTSSGEYGWHAVGRFSNFSIVKIVWNEIVYLSGIPVSEK